MKVYGAFAILRSSSKRLITLPAFRKLNSLAINFVDRLILSVKMQMCAFAIIAKNRVIIKDEQ